MHAHSPDPLGIAIGIVLMLILLWVGFAKGGFPGRIK